MKAKNELEIQRILDKLNICLSIEDQLCLERHFRNQIKQAFVHGIMSGPNSSFDNYYKQKYNFTKKEDDHFGI